MPGFLDKNAASIHSEYVSCLDGDYLGKVLFKNFLLNVVRLKDWDREFKIVTGKNGDAELDSNFPGDALVNINGRRKVVEIKSARASFQHTTRPTINAGWMFSKLREKDSGKLRRYDILFAVGIVQPRIGSTYS